MNEWEVGFERIERVGELVLFVEGEIDVAAAARFAQELESLIDAAKGRAVVDLSGVGFIDSAGVRELLKAQRRADAAGTDLVVHSPSLPCRRVLQVSGAWAEFTISDGAV